MKVLKSLVAKLTCGDDVRAEAAASSLASYGLEAVDLLRPLLDENSPDHRWWAVRTLAGIQLPQVTPLLIQALRDADPGVRQCAALALRHQPNPQATPALIETLSSPDSLLTHLAADALVAIGTPAVPELLKIIENGSRSARLEAARALALIADPQAIPALFSLFDEDSSLMEYWANEGLERMGVGMVYFNP
jgi:HEAT repeat protein